MGANKYRKGIWDSSELAEEFRMTESDARWGGRGAGWEGVGQATERQCMAGQGWVGWGRIYVLLGSLVHVYWEWGGSGVGVG